MEEISTRLVQQCPRCGKKKTVDEFYQTRSQCKACCKQEGRERRKAAAAQREASKPFIPDEQKRKEKIELFWSYVDKPDNYQACWEWKGRNIKNGAGYFTWEGTRKAVTRLAWEFSKGEPVPSKNRLLHACGNRTCCNPGHMQSLPRNDCLRIIRLRAML